MSYKRVILRKGKGGVMRTTDVLKTINMQKVPTEQQLNAVIDAIQIIKQVETLITNSEPYLRGNEEE